MAPDPVPFAYELVGTVLGSYPRVWLQDDGGMCHPLPDLLRELSGKRVRILVMELNGGKA